MGAEEATGLMPDATAEIEYLPLCELDWCARPSDPDYHVCIVCGALATEHAHVASRARAPGRKKDKANQVMLCVPHHREVDERQGGVHSHHIRDLPKGRTYFRLDIHGNELFQRVLEGGDDGTARQDAEGPEPEARRAVGENHRPQGEEAKAEDDTPQTGLALPAITPLTEDWAGLSDDALQAKFNAADQMQGIGFLLKCRAVSIYRDNHVQTWGESWTEHAKEWAGISSRTAYAYANIWQITVASDTYSADKVTPLTDSRSLMQFIGRKKPEDGAVAMESAVAFLAEYAEPPTVAQLAHRIGEEREEGKRHACPDCGREHTVKGGAMET